MDEEQGLASPLAGGLRGIRRSVSSSVFAGGGTARPVKILEETLLLIPLSPPAIGDDKPCSSSI